MQRLFADNSFVTTDVQQLEHHLLSVHGATGFEVPDPSTLRVRNNFRQLNDLALGFWTFGTPVSLKFGMRDYAALGLTLSGRGTTASGKQHAQAAVDCPTLVSPGRSTAFNYAADLQKVFVRFARQGLQRKLAALLGVPINRDICFDLAQFTSRDMLSGLISLVENLLGHAERAPRQLAPFALRELEDVVTTQLLLTGSHTMTSQLQRKTVLTSSGPVRRAEQFIESHWDQAITMDVLAEVTGVSARTLYRSFVQARGYSPMVFARKIRLEHAHALLSRPDQTTSVTGTAFKCGFSNLGRFAQEYARIFRELPSQTLARHQQGAGG